MVALYGPRGGVSRGVHHWRVVFQDGGRDMFIGIASARCEKDEHVGYDDYSWGLSAFSGRVLHNAYSPFGMPWKCGDRIDIM